MPLSAELTPKAAQRMEEKWALQREAIELLKLVVAEWQSDPMSVQCFDLRTVNRATEVVARLDKLTLW